MRNLLVILVAGVSGIACAKPPQPGAPSIVQFHRTIGICTLRH